MKKNKLSGMYLLTTTALLLGWAGGFAGYGKVSVGFPEKKNEGKNIQENLAAMGERVKEKARLYTTQNLLFIENKGQIVDQNGTRRTDIDFRLPGNGVSVFIGDGQLHYQWFRAVDKGANAAVPVMEGYRMDLVLLGSRKNVRPVMEQKQAYREHYFLGQQDQSDVAVASYQKITYPEIYPNIDWVLYVKNGQLEYDFVVKPGGNVSDIILQYKGHTGIKKNIDGGLTATTPMGSVSEAAPYSFQGDGRKVSSDFVLQNGTVRFKTGTYTGILTIDPTLTWATYYGDVEDEFGGYAVACDPTGNVYMTGETNSVANIATTGSFQSSFGGTSGFLPPSDAFLVKLDSSGVRQWATYYGGPDNERAVTCDASGNVYLAGETSSSSAIASPGAHQTLLGGGMSDAFLVKFDSTGKREWATYYGGADRDFAVSLACDIAGNIYMGGSSKSNSAIGTTGAYQPNHSGSLNDAFLAKFTTNGTRLWATYYGGNDGDEFGNRIACDPLGNVYLTGSSSSTNGIATNGSFQTGFNGYTDAFLVKFDSAGSRKWATYYGGTEYESGSGVSADAFGHVYLYGTTRGNNGIATTGSHQSSISGVPGAFGYPNETFLVQFDTTGTRKWATYFGGPGGDISSAVACDKWGLVYITGQTGSNQNIATPGTYQGSLIGRTNSFLAKFDSTGTQQWGTYYGGNGAIPDNSFSVAPDNFGSVYISGFTMSAANIATSGSHQDTYKGGSLFGGGGDAFLAKFADCPRLEQPVAAAASDTVCANSVNVYTVAEVPDAYSYTWTLPDGWAGTSTSNSIEVTVGNNEGQKTIRVTVNTYCSSSEVLEIPVYVPAFVPVDITVKERVLGTTSKQYATWQWYQDGTLIPDATEAEYTVAENGLYSVRVTDSFGCSDSSAYLVTNVTGINYPGAIKAQINVYPNPAIGKVYVQAPISVNVTLCSMDGRIVATRNNTSVIDIEHLSTGVYLLKITDQNGQLLKTEKIVKTIK